MSKNHYRYPTEFHPWSPESYKIDFDSSVEIKQRAQDGKWNLWRKYVNYTKKDGFTVSWAIIGVFLSSDDASYAKEKLRNAIFKNG